MSFDIERHMKIVNELYNIMRVNGADTRSFKGFIAREALYSLCCNFLAAEDDPQRILAIMSKDIASIRKDLEEDD